MALPLLFFCDCLFREEVESATQRLNAHVTELTQRLCKTETSLQANIHDYLSLRAGTLQSTRHMQEQLVAVNTMRDDALAKLADMQVLRSAPMGHRRPRRQACHRTPSRSRLGAGCCRCPHRWSARYIFGCETR